MIFLLKSYAGIFDIIHCNDPHDLTPTQNIKKYFPKKVDKCYPTCYYNDNSCYPTICEV